MQIVELQNVLTVDELTSCVPLINSATWEDGRATAKGRAAAVKHNEQMSTSCPSYAQLSDCVRQALARHREFFPRTLMARQSPLLFNRHLPGMAYGGHYDTVMRPDIHGLPMRSDWSYTVFLSNPESYEGGELAIAGSARVKLNAGSAIIYPSDTFHEVLPVTRGARFAAVGWLQSLVANRVERELLIELERTASGLIAANPNLPQADQLSGCVNRLLGLWARP